MRLKEVAVELARLRQAFDALRQHLLSSAAPPPPACSLPISELPLDALDPDMKLTCREVAARLGISLESLQARRARGRDRLPWDRSGRWPMVRVADLRAYIARLAETAAAKAARPPPRYIRPVPRFRGQPPKPAVALNDLDDTVHLDTVQVAGYLGLSIGSVDMARRYPDRWLNLHWQRDCGRCSKPWVLAGDLKAVVAARATKAPSRGPKKRQPASAAPTPKPSRSVRIAPAQDTPPELAIGLRFSPIVLKGKVITRLSELAEVLSQGWPADRKGKTYAAALRAAHAAYLGQTSPNEARLAFLVAAREAGLVTQA